MRRWLSALTVVLGFGGLFLMHGLDPAAHVPRVGAATAASEAHHGDHGAAHGPAVPGEWAGDLDVAHLAALCVAVLAAVVVHAVRRVGAGAPVPRRLAAPPWFLRRCEAFRPPGPGRLALCILRC